MKKIALLLLLAIGLLIIGILFTNSRRMSSSQYATVATDNESGNASRAKVNSAEEKVKGIESMDDNELLQFISELENIYEKSSPHEERDLRLEFIKLLTEHQNELRTRSDRQVTFE